MHGRGALLRQQWLFLATSLVLTNDSCETTEDTGAGDINASMGSCSRQECGQYVARGVEPLRANTVNGLGTLACTCRTHSTVP